MMRAVWRHAAAAGFAAGLALALSGCATTAARHSPPLSEDARAEKIREREDWLSQYAYWAFSGRAAIRKGSQGGSGRIEWTQHDSRRYSIALSAPVTRQSWRLDGDLHSRAGRLEGLDGGPREGQSAEDLLLQATGWAVPLQQLGRWVRGAPAAEFAVDAVEYDDQGRPTQLRQAGWTVRYTAWREGAVGQPDLPARIEAESGDARVRLIIEDWTFASP
jgi:outer membrane lipoprotein LolB